MMPRYENFHVLLKLLLRRGDGILLLRLADKNYWDLPGGRIDKSENRMPLKTVLAREVQEELGAKVRYRLGRPLFQFRRPITRSTGTYNFLTVYEGQYISGTIKLSSEHTIFQWVNPRRFTLKRKDFFTMEEYLAFRDHFKSVRYARN